MTAKRISSLLATDKPEATQTSYGEAVEVASDDTQTEEVHKLEKAHQWDPNLPQEDLEALRVAAKTHDPTVEKEVEKTFVDNSPYDEVKAAVRTDDGEETANTIRAWVLGTILSTIVTGLNMFLSMRSPAIAIPPVVVLLVVYPMGCLWAKIVTARRFRTFGVVWTLNPGPFNIKEHTVITLMANVTTNYAYSTDALLALKAKSLYNINMGWGFQLIFTLSSQMIGVALAGSFRRFLVWPSALIWPGNFSTTSLLYTLHDSSKNDHERANGWSMSRYRWFLYLGVASFIWYWVPGVLWQGLSVFAFVTWIRPNNATINQLFGGFTGLSLIPITFDWTYISAYLLNPLLSPAHAHLNTLIGLIVFVTIPAIGISYTGSWFSDYLPMSTSTTYDNTQNAYNVSRILGPNYTFDLAKYKSYSPMFLAPTFALNYGLSFAATLAALVHTILYHRSEIMHRLKASRNQEPDIHMRQISKYREAPDWWYLCVFVGALALGLATALGYPSQLPWWAFFVANILALVFIIPCCMIKGITNIQLSLNVISPFLAGYMIPGRPIGVMIFKVFSTIVLGQAQTMSADLKLAHYMKVPPRVTFASQVVPSIWACFVQIAVMNWTLGTIDGACEANQPSKFTCPNGRTFFSSSIVWGVIGPQRMFSGVNSVYTSLQYFWLLGALLPLLFYLLHRVRPQSRAMRFLHAPVMLGALQWLPPANAINFSTWATVGLLFNYAIRKRYHDWWLKYNYITAAALDAGLVIATVVIFFAIILPNTTIPQWWGNVTVFETMDALGTAFRKTVAEGEKFGPSNW